MASLLSKSKLPAADVALASRLRRLRVEDGLSQQDLATRIGLTRAALGNYEYAITPVPFLAGWKICQMLDASQQFFATGKEPVHPFVSAMELKLTKEQLLGFTGTFREGWAALLAKPWKGVQFRASVHDDSALTDKAARRSSDRDLYNVLIHNSRAVQGESDERIRLGRLLVIERAAAELRRRAV